MIAKKLVCKIFMFFFCVLVSWRIVAAQEEYLSLNLIPKSSRQRTGAPVPVWLQSSWRGTLPLKGRLQISVRGNNGFFLIRTDEMVFAPGQQIRSLLLPPLTGIDGRHQTTLNLVFLTDRKKFSFQPQRLTLVEPDLYSFNILAATSSYNRQNISRTGDELKIEKLVTGYDPAGYFRRTGVALMPVAKMPCTIFEYCAYDIVLLQSDSFAAMGSRQLEALRHWILAGGAVCLIPKDAEFATRHLEFINNLIKENSVAPATNLFKLDRQGHLCLETPTDMDVLTYRPGLGRMVIMRKNDTDFLTPEYFNSSSWRGAAAFLWRVRCGRLKLFINKGLWVNEDAPKSSNNARLTQYENTYNRNVFNRFSRNNYYQSLQYVMNKNISLLMPKSFQVVPTWLLAVIFVSLILLVGPVDYFVLGRFKRHYLTWYIFPLICLAFAGLTVKMANAYLGTGDHQASLTIIDEGVKGQILRRTCYELNITGSSKQVVKRCQNEFFSTQSSYSDFGRMIFDGRLFSDYDASFNMQQWSPRINRLNSFFGGIAKHASWHFPERWTETAGEAILRKIRDSNKNSCAVIYVLKNKKIYPIVESGRPPPSRHFQDALVSFIQKLCVFMDVAKSEDSLYSYVSGVSPAPFYGRSSLTMFDGEDSRETLVVVARYDLDKRNITISRRLYIAPSRVEQQQNNGRK